MRDDSSKSLVRRYLCLSIVMALFLSTGCVGPIWATYELDLAEDALAAAKAAKAEELAPYEYHRAQELLRKAEEEWGYSEFEVSRDYADRARDMAEKAQEKAETEPWSRPAPAGGTTTPTESPAQ